MKARDVITGVQFLSDQYGGTFRLSENDADAILSALAAAGYVVSRGPSSRSEELLRLLRIPTGRTPSPRPRFLKIREVCQVLALGETKVRDLIKRRELELIKIGAASRITVESVDRFIASAPRAAV